jgi:uncharacterized membrane protein YphA (DoxX/SURF4 family)
VPYRREIVMKTLAIVTTQLFLGLIVVAIGIAVLTMPDAVAHRLVPAGLAQAFRLGAGGAQIVAGLCLMVPRVQMFGAALLALMTLATAALGLLPSAGEASVARSTPRAEAAIAGRCGPGAALAAAGPIDWRI